MRTRMESKGFRVKGRVRRVRQPKIRKPYNVPTSPEEGTVVDVQVNRAEYFNTMREFLPRGGGGWNHGLPEWGGGPYRGATRVSDDGDELEVVEPTSQELSYVAEVTMEEITTAVEY